jgi:hypothetical protein
MPIKLKTRKTGSKPGEMFKFFENTYRLYMIAEATDPKLQKNYTYRQNKLGISSSKSIPHITMMHIHINGDNPDISHLIDGAGRVNHMLRKLIEKKYYQIAGDIYLKSSNTYYDIMGDFFAKVYVHDGDRKKITDFRMVLYSYLEMYLGKFTKRERVDIDGRVFFVYSYQGRELIAVPEYYHGIGVWTPHLSLIKLPHLRKENPELYEEFEESNYDIQILIDAMKGVKGSMSYLNLGMHFNKINLSAKKV